MVCNTGLEFPEILEFIRSIENVIWLKPEMSFREVLKKYGYPVISKRQAQYIREARTTKSEALRELRLTGTRKNGDFSQMSVISKKWQCLINAPFKISEQCCDVMKERPAKKYSKETGQMPYIGTMASEGKNREKTYLQNGCNAFDLKQPKSTPMAFWSDKDVWAYINKFNVSYSQIYDMGYKRTGCVFCAFGVHLEDRKTGTNRFKLMKITHPKLWSYCMDNLGMRGVLEYVGVQIEERQLELNLNCKEGFRCPGH